MSKIPKILFINRDQGGCGFFRMTQPADFIKRMGLAETEVILRSFNVQKEQILSSDLVIMQDMGDIHSSNVAQFCIENKVPYLAEFDDFIQHVSPHNLAGYGSWNPGTLYTYRAMEMAKTAFGLTVSTPQLAREYFPYNPTVYVIPNYLNKERWQQPIGKKVDGKIRIGWCGGNAHADDLKMIAPVIDQIVKEHKGKVVFETMGMTAQELHGVFPMENSPVEKVCPSCGYEGSLHHYPGEALENYPMMLAARGWDIAVAPVINNAFGNCKSDLKIKEYAAVRVPVVASNVVPYKEAVDDGAGILLAETHKEWYNNIKRLINNQKERDSLVAKNKGWVEKYWIQDNAQKTFEAYNQTISKAELLFGKIKK